MSGFLTVGNIPVIKGDKGDVGPAGPNTIPTQQAVQAALDDRVPPAVAEAVAETVAADSSIISAAALAVMQYLVKNGMQDPRIERVPGVRGFFVRFEGDSDDFVSMQEEPPGSEFLFRLGRADGSTVWGVRKDGSVYQTQKIETASQLNMTALSRAETSGPRVCRIGDSMSAQWAQPYITSSLNVTGVSEVGNISAGGEASYNIAARLGAAPARLAPVGGQIPASGSVDVTVFFSEKLVPQGDGAFNKWMFLQGVTSVVGTLAGVPGTWSVVRSSSATQYVHHPDDRYTFTRTSAGAAVNVPYAEPFLPTQSDELRASVPIINLGTNNLNADDMDQLENDVRAIVQYFRGSHKRFLIWSSLSVRPADASSTTGQRILEARRRLAKIGGAYFLDVVPWMSKYGLAYAGITPTSQDTTDMADGIVPVSLSASNADRHYNQTGYGIVGMLIANRMKQLGWYSNTAWVPDPIGEKS